MSPCGDMARIKELRDRMREHGEKAGVMRCHCSGCDRDRKEVLALLAKRKPECSETPSERG